MEDKGKYVEFGVRGKKIRIKKEDFISTEYEKGEREGWIKRRCGRFLSELEFPLVEIKNRKALKNHKCERVKDFNVCACVFKYKCPKCKKIDYAQSQYSVRFALNHGCFKCGKTIRKKRKGKKSKEKSVNEKTKIELGRLGENIVGLELNKRGYEIYYGSSGKEKHVDMYVRNNNNGKHISLQVKLREYNHNHFDNLNRTTIIKSKVTNLKLMADFYIGYMLNYNLFYIISKEDLIRKFNNFINFNFYKVKSKKEKVFPYENAWHLIENTLK
jgi:hypothetical protein